MYSVVENVSSVLNGFDTFERRDKFGQEIQCKGQNYLSVTGYGISISALSLVLQPLCLVSI